MALSTIATNNMTCAHAGTYNAAETADTIETTGGNRVLVGTYQHIILYFHLSASTNLDTINIVEGTNPPAFRAGLGGKTYVSSGGAKEICLGPLETARYMNSDGYIYITYPVQNSIAGTVEAFGLA